MSISTLVLAGATQLIQPDAVDDAAASIEPNFVPELAGKVWAPEGTHGEMVLRRLLITGYHTFGVAFAVTPVVDTLPLTALRTEVDIPATASGLEERFDVLIPLSKQSTAWPNVTTGIRGSILDAAFELEAPTHRWHIETLTFLIEPLGRARGRKAGE